MAVTISDFEKTSTAVFGHPVIRQADEERGRQGVV
jgi:hypothetical protein